MVDVGLGVSAKGTLWLQEVVMVMVCDGGCGFGCVG